MSLLGIDVGTTGCKAGLLNEDGRLMSLAYREYPILRPQPGWAEFDSQQVWGIIKGVIAEVAQSANNDPVRALCVTSCGEAMTPVSVDRVILGNCILGLDNRGEEYCQMVSDGIGREELYAINGNILGTSYSAPKLAWLRDHNPELFSQAEWFLLWSGLVAFLLGGEPASDPSLASRTLLFDLMTGNWSETLLEAFRLPIHKLPKIYPPTTVIGQVNREIAVELGFRGKVDIVVGGHDQCCTALGVGVTEPGQATYGIGTFICITPVHRLKPNPSLLGNGMNVEYHVLKDLYVSFLYNASGGALLRWARDTFAQREKTELDLQNRDVYDLLMMEMPENPTGLLVLPHFAPCGPPSFEADTSGVILGLTLETDRGEMIKGLLEGMTFYFKNGIDLIAQSGLTIQEYRATGGGSKSSDWLQLSADILGQPIAQVAVSECGVLGAAILAGVGTGVFSSAAETASRYVKVNRVFEPRSEKFFFYQERLQLYRQLYPNLKKVLSQLKSERYQPAKSEQKSG
jgi:xylulokinase